MVHTSKRHNPQLTNDKEDSQNIPAKRMGYPPPYMYLYKAMLLELLSAHLLKGLGDQEDLVHLDPEGPADLD